MCARLLFPCLTNGGWRQIMRRERSIVPHIPLPTNLGNGLFASRVRIVGFLGSLGSCRAACRKDSSGDPLQIRAIALEIATRWLFHRPLR